MATLSVWETVRASNGVPVVRLDERTTYQAVSFTGTPGQSEAFDSDTSIITVKSDAACALRVGPNPTADVTDFPLDANILYDFEVQPGQKLSVIAT